MPSGTFVCGRLAAYQQSYSSQRTSHLPSQNGSMATSSGGPSSARRPASPSLLPIVNRPAGIGTMSNVTPQPGIVSVYGRDAGAAAATSCAFAAGAGAELDEQAAAAVA